MLKRSIVIFSEKKYILYLDNVEDSYVVVINMNFMFFRLLHYFIVSLTGSAFKEQSSSSANVGYDQMISYDQLSRSTYTGARTPIRSTHGKT